MTDTQRLDWVIEHQAEFHVERPNNEYYMVWVPKRTLGITSRCKTGREALKAAIDGEEGG